MWLCNQKVSNQLLFRISSGCFLMDLQKTHGEFLRINLPPLLGCVTGVGGAIPSTRGQSGHPFGSICGGLSNFRRVESWGFLHCKGMCRWKWMDQWWSDQWVSSPSKEYKPCIRRWTNPLIRSPLIHPLPTTHPSGFFNVFFCFFLQRCWSPRTPSWPIGFLDEKWWFVKSQFLHTM